MEMKLKIAQVSADAIKQQQDLQKYVAEKRKFNIILTNISSSEDGTSSFKQTMIIADCQEAIRVNLYFTFRVSV